MKRSITGLYSLPLITLILFTTTLFYAQDTKDLEGWSAVELNLKATDKLSVSVSEHLRYRNDISSLKNYFTQIKVNYELFKNLELGSGARYITDNDDVGNKQGHEYLFRYQFDAVFKQKIDKVMVSFRLRYQNKNQLGISESEGDTPTEYTRYRMGLSYKVRTLKLNVKLFGEVFNEPQSPEKNKGFNRHRYTLKLSRKFKNFGALDAFYALQDDYSTPSKKSKSIVGIKYSYNINLTK
tara:strand:+ start:493 stop:1209 length:717 start_codon:yes stop_codon:yes gene_type:complete